MSDVPAPQPEGVLIRRARMARGLSLEGAAARMAEMADGQTFSASRWSQLETGYRFVNGQPIVQRAKDERLAQMAYIVGLDPVQLEEAGRVEAAAILRELERQKDRAKRQQEKPAPPSVPPSLNAITAYFRDARVPLAERQRRAVELFQALPYYMRGEAPPEISNEDGNGKSFGRETA